jgi:hypothetical protein
LECGDSSPLSLFSFGVRRLAIAAYRLTADAPFVSPGVHGAQLLSVQEPDADRRFQVRQFGSVPDAPLRRLMATWSLAEMKGLW